MKKLLALLLCFAAAALRAQDDSDPGRSFIANSVPSTQDGGSAQAMFEPALSPISQTSSAIAEQITPDIQALAGNLGNNPTQIFNFVHDQIKYVHYFGSLKGAELTLLERSGNDFDQCALLSALLQAAGYPTGYQFGYMKMPYDGANGQDLHHWLGLSLQNTNWNNTLNYFSYLLGSRGYGATFFNFAGDTNDLAFQRIWVTLSLSNTIYYLDPSFKVSEPVSGVNNLGSAMGLNTGTLLTAAGGTDTGYSVSGLTEGSLRSALQNCNGNLLTYISNNIPNASVAQVIGGQQIVSSIGSPLPTSLLFPLYTNSSYPFLNWTNQPTNFMSSFSISFGGTNRTWLTPQLQGQRISLTFNTNGLGQLWLEDSNVLQTSNTGVSNVLAVVLTAQHPYGSWNTSLNIPVDTGIYDRSSTNSYQRTNSSYAIMYSFEASPQWLQKRQQKLDAYRAQGLADTSRQVTTETLNVMGLGWMVQTELSLELLSQEWGQLPHHHHRFGRMGQEQSRGYYVDVYLQQDATFPNTGFNQPDQIADNEVFDVSSYVWSAMEHGIIEQLQNSNLVAASTVKMLEIASTNSSQAVYMASSANWTTTPNVRSLLSNYGGTLANLDNLISQGFILLLPQNGSNHIAGAGTWAGDGYVQLGTTANGRSMGMIIGGGYNGGYVSDPDATVSQFVPYISEVSENSITFYNPQSPTVSTSGQTGADPVDLVDGSFQITSTDLSLGQTEPRGLNLTRYYSSARYLSNPAGMAPGWLHSYYCNVVPLSAPESGLGATTVGQMSPMIVATYAALNFYTNTGTLDPKNWTVTALIAKWGIDQIINNAVSVNLGNSTLQFTRQPDGSYTPPGNCTMTLLQTNGAYWLQERHGRTFKFSGGNVLTNIVDQYGQTMNLKYNASSLVTNVTDWKGRSLAFTYTNSTLISVADNTGRSVSYAYTNGDLTYFTDPEQKTTAYAYDTNNEIIATFDSLKNLVESNYYDGSGHVTTQLTRGDTNETWQIFANGYQTIEIDPAGDTQVFTYDSQSRLIAQQDGMGDVTQMVYDGQGHVIQTISPLSETNQFIYDGSNNLVEVIDSLGNSSAFVYDSQNRLTASRDSDGNTNHFGYNAQFSLTGSTNGNGDYTILAYNSDGTILSRQDAAGATSYNYDTNGQLNSITYPSSLGVESFTNNVFGDPISHTDVRGFTTTFKYNNRRQLTNTIAPNILTNSIAYDANANVSTATDGRGFVTSNSWSVTRHLLTTTLPATAQGTPTIVNAYDSRDWLANVQNPLGKITSYTNDAAHRLVAATDPLGRTTTFGYDPDSHHISLTDPAGNKTVQNYDARGDLVRVLNAATNIMGKAYDGAGNLVCLTNLNTNVWRFYYDRANRLTNTVSPTNRSAVLVYNNRGLLQSGTDPMHQTTTFGYDMRGRMTSKTDNLGINNYQYDGDNNLTLVTNVGNGTALSWGFDADNRPNAFTNASEYVIQYQYDADNNLTKIIYPGNRPVQYLYDSNNRMTSVTDWAGRQTTYTYDLNGRLTGMIRPNGTLRTMVYDDNGQLTNIVEKTTAQFPIVFYNFHFDAAGRSDWEFKGPLPHPFTQPTRNMTFDVDDRLATFNGTNVNVDADGNLTYGPLTNSTFGIYTYDARNELTSAAGTTYGYDPAENRTSLTNGSAATTFVINPQGSEALMRIKNGTTNYYIYGAAGLVYEVDETSTATNSAFYHFDARGSTVAFTDKNGNLTDQIEYSPYGTTTYRAGTNDTPFCYNGAFGVMTDPNGLLYMRARYYNPYLCRFINADPSGFSGGMNFYAFANANPVSNVDPLGQQPGVIEMVTGYGPAGGESVSDYNDRVQATAQQALPIEAATLGGVAVGAGGAATVSLGAAGLVAVGVPQSVVTGGLLVTGGTGFVVSGVSIYENPSPNNVAFTAGSLGGAGFVGGMIAEPVNSALSPAGYQPSGPATLSSDVSMAWRDANGNINPLAFLGDWLLPGAQVGPMSTGPSTLGAAGTITGAGSGVAGGAALLFGGIQYQSPTGK